MSENRNSTHDHLPEDELTSEEMANFEQDTPPEEYEDSAADTGEMDALRAENEDLKKIFKDIDIKILHCIVDGISANSKKIIAIKKSLSMPSQS